MRLLTPGSRARRVLRTALGAGLTAALRVTGADRAQAGARVLYYHRIDDELHRSCVTRRAFREQMQYLRNSSYRIVPLGTLMRAFEAGEEFAPRTLWSLENCFTGALAPLQRSSPQRFAEATIRLEGLLVEAMPAAGELNATMPA